MNEEETNNIGQPTSDRVLELSRRREAGEINPNNLSLEGIYYADQEWRPLVRNDVGNMPVVLTQEDFKSLGFVSFVTNKGELIDIFYEEGDEEEYKPGDTRIIIFPDELGEVRESVIKLAKNESKDGFEDAFRQEFGNIDTLTEVEKTFIKDCIRERKIRDERNQS